MTDDIERFTPAERSLHWTTALATLLLLGTGGLIWQHLDNWEIGEFNVVEQIHLWLGGLLLIGGLVVYALRRKRRIPHADKRFALGQRLGLSTSRVALLFVIATGLTLFLREFVTMAKPFRSLVKQVHLWSAGAIAAFVLVHLVMVLLVPKHRGLLRGMLTGRIDRRLARRVSPEWVARIDADTPAAETREPAVRA